MTVVDAVTGNLDKLRAMIAYDGTTDRDTLILQTKTLLSASSEMLFEAGKRLCVLKETLDYGAFLEALKKVGIGHDTATRFMNATLKFGSNPNYAPLRNLPRTKIYEFALLDDDYLKELSENGTVAGLTLDEYDQMTTRELRKTVRELNDKAQKKEESLNRLLEKMQEEKQELLDENHRLRTRDPQSVWSEDAKKVNQDILILTTDLIQTLGRAFDLAKRVQELKESEFSTGQMCAISSIQSLASQVDEYNASLIETVEGIIPDFKRGLMGKSLFDDDYIDREKVSFDHPMSPSQDAEFKEFPEVKS